MKSFSNPQSAARDVRVLLDYLWAHHKPHFLYRGQTREYPGPLLPSAYRGKHVGPPCDADALPVRAKSLRGIGRRFCEVRLFRNFDDTFLAYSGEDTIRDRDELTLLHSITYNHTMAKRIESEGFERAIRRSVHPTLLTRFEHRLTLWEHVINAQHKGLLRLNGANQFFGFRVGQTLAQHYIESSEFLDATRSPTIAAFFANYTVPASGGHRRILDHDAAKEIGIIYRFFAPSVNDSAGQFDYYSAPDYFDAAPVIGTLASSGLESQASWSPDEFIFLYKMTGGHRDWMLLALPSDSIPGTRIGRQEAAFVVPDEIHDESRDPRTGHQDVRYQAIEDLSARSGLERFYFLRAGVDLADEKISEGHLWPSDEEGERLLTGLFHKMVDAEDIIRARKIVLGPIFEPDMWYPARHDLIREKAPDLTGMGAHHLTSGST